MKDEHIPSRDRSEPTINADAWLEGGPSLRAPKHGWDNGVDIEEAKKTCRDRYGAVVYSKQGLKTLYDVSTRLYHHAISETLPAELIQSVMQPPFKLQSI